MRGKKAYLYVSDTLDSSMVNKDCARQISLTMRREEEDKLTVMTIELFLTHIVDNETETFVHI